MWPNAKDMRSFAIWRSISAICSFNYFKGWISTSIKFFNYRYFLLSVIQFCKYSWVSHLQHQHQHFRRFTGICYRGSSACVTFSNRPCWNAATWVINIEIITLAGHSSALGIFYKNNNNNIQMYFISVHSTGNLSWMGEIPVFPQRTVFCCSCC